MAVRKLVWAPALALALSLGLAGTASAAPAANPAKQFGEVHSCTTGGRAGVETLDAGYDWFYLGHGGPGSPLLQDGVVHSYTTGGNADVATNDGGLIWSFVSEPFLFCSPP